MSNVKRILAMFLAVIVLTGSVHALASNSASVKEDKSAIEQEMANGEIKITGNHVVVYDGAPVTFGEDDDDFNYLGDGMPVWYRLKSQGQEKGVIDENYTRVRNIPTDAGKYAVAVYNDKIDQFSEPFYFEIAKAPLKLQWPMKVSKVFDGDKYFNMRLKYLGGLVGDDGNNPNIEFRVRVIADGSNVGAHKVLEIERFAGSVNMDNYSFVENEPTSVEILSPKSVLLDALANPGDLSNVFFPENVRKDGQVLFMDEKDKIYGMDVIRSTFEDILKETSLKDEPLDEMDESEKITLETNKNVLQAVKRDAYINIHVDANIMGVDNKALEIINENIDNGAEIVSGCNIKILAESVEQNRLVYELGEIVNLDQNLSFTVKLNDNIKDGQGIKVARVVDGQVEFLSEHFISYNKDKNTLTFKADKGGVYAIVRN